KRLGTVGLLRVAARRRVAPAGGTKNLPASAGGVSMLLFLGIRSAWDLVTYLAIEPFAPRGGRNAPYRGRSRGSRILVALVRVIGWCQTGSPGDGGGSVTSSAGLRSSRGGYIVCWLGLLTPSCKHPEPLRAVACKPIAFKPANGHRPHRINASTAH